MTAKTQPLLRVRDLSVEFGTGTNAVRVVDGVGFDLMPGQALAIVGESGSGKSVSVRSILRLLPRTGRVVSGSAHLKNDDLLALPTRALRRIRGRDVGMVFQNAMEAMNPTLTLERQLTEHLLWHGICDRTEARERAVHALDEVGIPDPERRIRGYPFQLSGGMRQRAMIAMAMVTEPALLIADEPTTAVDVTVQRQLLDVLAALRAKGTGIVMITHDLGVARHFCDDTVVMYAGRVVERAATEELLQRPRHPYAAGLLASSVEVGGRNLPLEPIQGSPPDPSRRPQGCAFHPRCSAAQLPRCQHEQPLIPVGANHEAACWKAERNV